MRDTLETFSELNAQLLAVDPHEVWSGRYLLREAGADPSQARFPLLLDPTQTVSATYGVAFQMKIHVEWSNRPATFIIDEAGILRKAFRGTRFGDRPSPTEIAAYLKTL